MPKCERVPLDPPVGPKREPPDWAEANMLVRDAGKIANERPGRTAIGDQQVELRSLLDESIAAIRVYFLNEINMF